MIAERLLKRLNIFIYILHTIYIMKKTEVKMQKPTQSADMDIQGGSATDSGYERYWGAKG